MVMLFARSSIALSSVRFRHIQAGFVNRSLDMFVNRSGLTEKTFADIPLSAFEDSFDTTPYIPAAVCFHATGPSFPIPIVLFPFH